MIVLGCVSSQGDLPGAAQSVQNDTMEQGVALFDKVCAGCPSKDGRARTRATRKMGVKDLNRSRLTDQQVVFQIMEGRQDVNKRSNMPAFRDKLTRQQIDSLLPVLRSIRSRD